MTWVEDGDEVGWSEYDGGTGAWSLPGYESYAFDSVQDARDRIRSQLVEP